LLSPSRLNNSGRNGKCETRNKRVHKATDKVILAQYGTEKAPRKLHRLVDGPLLVYLGNENPINMKDMLLVHMKVLALVISAYC
jgi:hypothetical protein